MFFVVLLFSHFLLVSSLRFVPVYYLTAPLHSITPRSADIYNAGVGSRCWHDYVFGVLCGLKSNFNLMMNQNVHFRGSVFS